MTAGGSLAPAPGRWSPLDIVRCLAGDDVDDVSRLVALLAADTPGSRDAWVALQQGGQLPRAAAVIGRAGLTSRLDARRQEALRTAHEVNALRNALVRRLAIDVSRRLGDAGVRVLWAKGVWLAHYVYEQPALRVMSDVDVFVPPGRRGEAVAVLRTAGFEPNPTVEAVGVEVYADTLRPPGDSGGDTGGVSVDVHDVLQLSPRRTWGEDVLWEGAVRARPGRVEVWLPAPEAGFLLTAVHTLKHGLDLRHLIVAVGDTLALMRRYEGEFDAARMVRRFDDEFDTAAVYLLLSAAGESALPPTGRHLLAEASSAATRHGTKDRVDRLLRTTRHLRFMRQQDFSLFAVGESGLGPAAVARLLLSSVRWRRRVRLADARTGAGGRSALSRLGTANWRYAWTTYLAGRLSGRLTRGPGSAHR